MKAITYSAKFWIGLLFCLGLLVSAGPTVKTSRAAGRDDQQAAAKAANPSNEELAVDDGSYEVRLSGDGVIAVNRLTPSVYPATLQTIRIFFIPSPSLPNPSGAMITLIAFTGATGTTTPPATPTLLINQAVTLPTVPASGAFIDFPIQNGPTINGGDFYVGFKAPNPAGGVFFATDSTGNQRQRSFASGDNGASFQPLAPPVIPFLVNLMIRAVVANSAAAAPRINVPATLNFGASDVGVAQQQNLTITNTGDAPLNITAATSNNGQFTVVSPALPITIAPGAQAQLAIRFTPASAGAQNATLTIASNDPANPSVVVALSGISGSATNAATVFINSGMAVTSVAAAPPGAGIGVLLGTQYAVFVPPGASQLKIELTGTQNLDLFARFNQRIAVSGGSLLTDFSSQQQGVAPETITITPASSPALQSGLYYIAIVNFGPGAANFTLTATVTGGTAAGVVATTSAASFVGTEASAEMIVAFFGTNLATGTQVATTVPLPATLLGTTVRVRDNAGTERAAPLFFVSTGQVNALIPAGTATGTAQVIITSGDGKVSVGTIQIAATAPGLFTANANGLGVPAATAFRLKAGGAQSFEALSRFDAGQNSFVPIPIDLGAATDQVFLILNGTGIRGRTSLSAVTATIGGVAATVSFAGPQGDFVGLDQINVGIPRSLIGRGDVDVVLTVDGKTTNTVKINIK